MSNYCNFTIAFYGDVKNIKKLKKNFYNAEINVDKMITLSSLISDYNGDDRSWANPTGKEGFLISPSEIKKYPANPDFFYFSYFTLLRSLECPPEIYNDAFFIIDGYGAWSEKPDLIKAIADKYNVNYDTYAEEAGCDYFINTDTEQTFFSDRYILIPKENGYEYFDNTQYFDTLENMLLFLESVGVKIYINGIKSEKELEEKIENEINSIAHMSKFLF